MKLAACYTVFNGCELLEKSIEQIYDEVDVIIIAAQYISNTGNAINEDDYSIIINLQRLDKVCLMLFNPNPNINTKENERNKHQILIDKARELDCSHFFLSATDHYYKKDEFIKAKEIAKDYDLTASQMFTYYKEPTYQLEPIEEYWMPFIMKIKPNTKITQKHYSFVVDPSVRIEPVATIYLFKRDELMMHHFSMVRDDIESKFNNSASAGNWKHKVKGFIEEFKKAAPGDLISYFKGRKLIEVEDYFNIK